MFIIISNKNGARVKHRSVDGEVKEKFETYEQAHRVLEAMEKGLQKGLYRIEAIECGRCGGNHDVTILHVDGEPKVFCLSCRVDLFGKKKTVGRPSVGITKKVSLTLPEEEWEWLDEKAEGNRSNFLREVVRDALGGGNEWDNYACLGYAIMGASSIGLSEEKTKELIKAIHGGFDWWSVGHANEVYQKSDY